MAMPARLVALAPHVELECLQSRAFQRQAMLRKAMLKPIH